METEHKKCNCPTCLMAPIWEKCKPHLTKEEIEIFVRGISYLMDGAMDGDYYRSIFKGDWPTSVEQLELALTLAKEKRAKGEAGK